MGLRSLHGLHPFRSLRPTGGLAGWKGVPDNNKDQEGGNMSELAAKIDKCLCILLSMGRILTLLMASEDQFPEPSWLSDLGLIISMVADTALELVQCL